MPQPTAYEPSYAFIELASWPGDKLDIELGNLQTTLDEIMANLALIQRDDGMLANGSVHVDAFSTAALAFIGSGWTAKGEWVTATAYAKLDFVSVSGSSYLCAVAHTAGTFATDLAAGKWTPIYVVPDTAIDDGEITNAKLADMAQATIKGRAAAAGTGVPVDLTATQARTILNVADGANAYVHPNHTGDVTSVADGALTIGADKVTLAHLENGAQGEVLVYGAAGAPSRLGVGTAGQFLKSQGSGAGVAWDNPLSWKFSSSAVSVGTGATKDVTGINAVGVINEITVYLDLVSTGSADQTLQLRLGSAAGVVASGYTGGCGVISGGSAGVSYVGNSTGFNLTDASSFDAAIRAQGAISLVHLGSNVWRVSGSLNNEATSVWFPSGTITLPGALDRIQLTTAGGASSFDNGTISTLAR
jgi:hypothetical protein